MAEIEKDINLLEETPVGSEDINEEVNVEIEGEIPGPITKKLLAAYGELVGFDLLDQAFNYENVEHEDLISTLNHKNKK